MSRHPNEKTCYCKTCGRWFHYLGITNHRKAHRVREEDCVITYTNGDTYRHHFARKSNEQTHSAKDRSA